MWKRFYAKRQPETDAPVVPLSPERARLELQALHESEDDRAREAALATMPGGATILGTARTMLVCLPAKIDDPAAWELLAKRVMSKLDRQQSRGDPEAPAVLEDVVPEVEGTGEPVDRWAGVHPALLAEQEFLERQGREVTAQAEAMQRKDDERAAEAVNSGYNPLRGR